MAEPSALALPFDEAIRFFRQKVNVPTRRWDDLWQGMHARGFMVAGAMKDELLSDFRAAIDKAIANGTTLAEFRRDFDSIVARHGWVYNGGRDWRSRVIFDTNLRTAYAAGRWEQIQQLKDRRPYLRYTAIMDARTRPEHAAWHGAVLHADHAWWKTHYPPNGWNCRCTVTSLSKRDLDRYGFKLSGTAPPSPLVEVKNPLTGAVERIPKGIDRGFAYNVGESAWGRGGDLAAMERHGEWRALDAPGLGLPSDLPSLPPDRPLAKIGPRASGEAGLRDALRAALGGDEVILTDPRGERVRLSQAIVDHMLADAARLDGREAFFPFLRELVERPAEIWLGFARNEASGRVAVRVRYVKLIEVDKDRVFALVGDRDNWFWSGMTFYRARARAPGQLRSGVLLYRR